MLQIESFEKEKTLCGSHQPVLHCLGSALGQEEDGTGWASTQGSLKNVDLQFVDS